MTAGRGRRRGAALAALLLPAALVTGCSSVVPRVPPCSDVERLSLVAQSVPGATYVPCLDRLPTGWTVTRFQAQRGSTAFSLLSDRANGRAVDVRYQRRCDVSGAAPATPRTVGGRTYLRLQQISPRYTGRLYDVFPGGCVTYDVDLERGPHIALMEDLLAAVRLVPRRELRVELRHQLGEELDP